MERPLSQPSYNIFTFREEEFGKKFKCINGIINGKKMEYRSGIVEAISTAFICQLFFFYSSKTWIFVRTFLFSLLYKPIL